ncbi:MAG: hypothetical protein KTR27_01610 [Leptolyngbyaceae cyanobacterium MAG.088]|nr:hypothetical protein [Leptolyngbyaceae cyanobacterium MAG.088]
MQHLDYFHLCHYGEPIAEGVVLPSGACALSWYGSAHSHGVFPSFEMFKDMQARLSGRKIKSVDEHSLDYSKTFYLKRNQDWSGISGTGLVAVGFEFEHLAMLHWFGKDGSTFWYESVTLIEQVHGHEGRTQIARCSISKLPMRHSFAV